MVCRGSANYRAERATNGAFAAVAGVLVSADCTESDDSNASTTAADAAGDD